MAIVFPHSLPRHLRRSRHFRRPVWLTRNVRTQFQCKKQSIGGGSRDRLQKTNLKVLFRSCRCGVRKVKVQLKLRLARDTEDNKTFYHCINSKVRKAEAHC